MTDLLPRDRITAALAAANKDGKVALVPFVTAGYPEKDAFIATLQALATASEVIEVGVPFSDPMADGVTIQRSSRAAIAAGVTLHWIIAQLQASGGIGAPVVLMSYLNPLLAYGFAQLAKDAAAAGVCGFIVPDLPWEESAEFRAALDTAGSRACATRYARHPGFAAGEIMSSESGFCLRGYHYRDHRWRCCSAANRYDLPR